MKRYSITALNEFIIQRQADFHQRSPFYVSSRSMVERLEELMQEIEREERKER